MLETLLIRVRDAHLQHYGVQPQWLASAPGRVNLIGDHTDYTGGFALPFAIDRYTVVSASADRDEASEIRIFSTLSGESVSVTLGDPDASVAEPFWHDYLRGVLTLMRAEGFDVPGLSICVHGDLPVGSGLSSSASLELAVATLVEGINGRQLNSLTKILLCQRAEHDYARVPCGILDQFSICEARQHSGLLLDCRSQSAESVAMTPEKIGFLVIDSQIRHQHSGGGYAARREQCEEAQIELGCSLRDATPENVASLSTPLLQKRAGHVVSENKRVEDFSAALSHHDLALAGEIMFASHDSLRHDFEVSTPEVDALVEICRTTGGVLGARMTGGGFGGSVIVMAPPHQLPLIASSIADRYSAATGHSTEPLLVNVVSGCQLHTSNV